MEELILGFSFCSFHGTIKETKMKRGSANAGHVVSGYCARIGAT